MFDLEQLQPHHQTLVGVDSDGCVFDSMEVKQRRCFYPLFIELFEMPEPLASLYVECQAFVSLYSVNRGKNRFPGLVQALDLLLDRPEAQPQIKQVPPLTRLRQLLSDGVNMSNEVLEEELENTRDPELEKLLLWSVSVDNAVKQKVKNLPPFDGVKETLAQIQRSSDIIVVSATPNETVAREWRYMGLEAYPQLVAGQEAGKKEDVLRKSMVLGNYKADKVLMVGDSPGDLRASQLAGCRFFPVIPGREGVSWKSLQGEVYPNFLLGTYSKNQEKEYIRCFLEALPERPSWACAD